jgi:phage terminase large subunit
LTTVNIRFNARNQFLPYINRTQRWAAVVAHRRAGKTVACIMDLIIRALANTKLIDDEELADARRTLTPEQYAQEYECSFNAAVLGAYYGRDMELAESEERITRVPHDRAADTYASWDLGIGDSTAIWIFQVVGKEWHWLKYYENSSQRLDHYVDWIKSLPFAVHKHFLPHDAEARELQTGNSRVEFLTQRGLNCEVVPRHNVDDRINAARVKFNRFFFDKQGCEAGIKALRMYRAEYDDKHKTLKPRPLHDWASHGADAFGGGVMGGEEKRMKPVTPKRNMSWVV